jgi:hypothetical protein
MKMEKGVDFIGKVCYTMISWGLCQAAYLYGRNPFGAWAPENFCGWRGPRIFAPALVKCLPSPSVCSLTRTCPTV